jgi:hypothetical protein
MRAAGCCCQSPDRVIRADRSAVVRLAKDGARWAWQLSAPLLFGGHPEGGARRHLQRPGRRLNQTAGEPKARRHSAFVCVAFGNAACSRLIPTRHRAHMPALARALPHADLQAIRADFRTRGMLVTRSAARVRGPSGLRPVAGRHEIEKNLRGDRHLVGLSSGNQWYSADLVLRGDVMGGFARPSRFAVLSCFAMSCSATSTSALPKPADKTSNRGCQGRGSGSQ